MGRDIQFGNKSGIPTSAILCGGKERIRETWSCIKPKKNSQSLEGMDEKEYYKKIEGGGQDDNSKKHNWLFKRDDEEKSFTLKQNSYFVYASWLHALLILVAATLRWSQVLVTYL